MVLLLLLLFDFSSKWWHVNYFPLNMHESFKQTNKKCIFFISSTCLAILQKSQLNGITTQNCQLKLFDTAVTLKYAQGHWKWYEWVELKGACYHQAKFNIYHIYSVQENHNVQVFCYIRCLASRPVSLTVIITYAHIFHKSQIQHTNPARYAGFHTFTTHFHTFQTDFHTLKAKILVIPVPVLQLLHKSITYFANISCVYEKEIYYYASK